jgi:hypothetical protein
MKTALFIAVIAMVLMTGLVSADPVDMSIYDRNDDGMIDAAERVNLDIDIENSRVTPTESYVIDSYTMDGTLILNDEFQAAFLNPEAYPRDTKVDVVGPVDSGPVVAPESATDPTPEVTPEPEVTPITSPEGDSDLDNNGSIP